MADQKDPISIGSNAWNIADSFTKLKIMRILIDIDLQEAIAMFGKENMADPVMPEEIPQKRIEALNRILFSLRQLLGNCKFSIREKKDKEMINKFEERIENVEKVIDNISYTTTNDVTKETIITIEEEHFKNCFDVLRNIKDELNFPLDRASLIFRHSDDMNLDDIMKTIVEGG